MLLKNEITIWDAFLKDYVEKFLIEYDGVEKDISGRIIVEHMLLKDLLPTEGEYMDAEEDEANVVVKLQFHLGDNNERLFMTLETVSIFEVINGSTQELTEEIVQQKWLVTMNTFSCAV